MPVLCADSGPVVYVTCITRAGVVKPLREVDTIGPLACGNRRGVADRSRWYDRVQTGGQAVSGHLSAGQGQTSESVCAAADPPACSLATLTGGRDAQKRS